jgi:phospholipid/cholesterol/gamma-HCH transport system substrate-binding protein
MSRVVPLLGALVLAAATIAAARGGGEDPYLVRAVFDNASFVIPGEDVKVAGVKAGAIDSLDLTADNKAVVVLRIDDPAFRPFRRNARCRIALQSLLGEQFVECEPGVKPAPPLPRIGSGRGEGQHLLGVESTTTPIGVDLINNIMRVPERERLRLIVNELGAGLAGNGERLRAALRRASPALQQADRVIATLAEQDRLLARLVDASDEVLAPLAERRKDLGGFIRHAGDTAAATAERGDDLERNLERLPGFLRELGPAADRLGALADEMEPALRTLGAEAPAINRTAERFGPFVDAATPALVSLGSTAARGRRTFPRIGPLTGDVAAFSSRLRPLAADLAALASSFDDEGGIEALMRFIYFYTGTVNGEDELGHYMRSGLGVSACSARISERAFGCESTFDTSGEATAATAGLEPLVDYLLGTEDAR